MPMAIENQQKNERTSVNNKPVVDCFPPIIDNKNVNNACGITQQWRNKGSVIANLNTIHFI